MLDKPRNPRRDAGNGSRGAGKPPRTGSSGERPKDVKRPAGGPVKGPAGPRKSAGVDQKTLQMLEERGMLNAQGKSLLDAGRPGSGRGAAAARGGAAKTGVGRTPGAQAGNRDKGPGAPARFSPKAGRSLSVAEEAVAERLHKVMAQAGLASRRHSEELIQAGRVKVNGVVVTALGTKVIPGKDIIEVDGRPLGRPEELVHILMNKPKGYVTTLFDPQGRPKVVDLLEGEIAERVYPVGRLDYDTEGLLLLTNDGELANAIMHPSMQVKKTYIAKVRGVPGPAKLKALEEGIELEDGLTAPAEVKLVDAKGPNAATVSIRIHEGRNRQVRRMFEAVGHEVIHLKRTTLGPLTVKEMAVGEWRYLTPTEIADLRRAVGLRSAAAPAGRAAKGARPASARAAGGRNARPGRAGGPRPEAGFGADAPTPAAPRGARSRPSARIARAGTAENAPLGAPKPATGGPAKAGRLKGGPPEFPGSRPAPARSAPAENGRPASFGKLSLRKNRPTK